MKTSEKLYSEIKNLEKKLFNFTFVSQEDAVGKTIKKVYDTWEDSYDGNKHSILIIFEDNTALYFDGVYFSIHPIIWTSHYSDYHNKSWSGTREFTDWLLRDMSELINEDVLQELLALAVKWEDAKHQETLKEEIQRKLDEISKLKEQL